MLGWIAIALLLCALIAEVNGIRKAVELQAATAVQMMQYYFVLYADDIAAGTIRDWPAFQAETDAKLKAAGLAPPSEQT